MVYMVPKRTINNATPYNMNAVTYVVPLGMAKRYIVVEGDFLLEKAFFLDPKIVEGDSLQWLE